MSCTSYFIFKLFLYDYDIKYLLIMIPVYYNDSYYE